MKNAICHWALAGAAALLLTVPSDAGAADRHRSRGDRNASHQGRHDSHACGDRYDHRRDDRADRSRRDHRDRYDSRDRYRDRYRDGDRYRSAPNRSRHGGHARSPYSGHRHGRPVYSRSHRGHSDFWEGLHFVAHVIDGLDHRNYDCGCRRRWEVGYWDSYRDRGHRHREWVPGRWITISSCGRH